jgi:hypothetical protein
MNERHVGPAITDETNPLLLAALSYARRGWPVVPLRRGDKAPDGRLAPHGLNDASLEESELRAWWRASPRANVGIRTGAGLDVVDVDSASARASLEELVETPLIPSIVVRTARGWHWWFASSGLTSRAGVLEGVDVRGAGGYVVAPPSMHPSGHRYVFVDPETGESSSRLPDRQLRPAPAWLVDALGATSQPTKHDAPPVRLQSAHYARAALASECAAVANAPQGSRNDRLNRAAFALGTLIGADLLDAEEARTQLIEAALRSGLKEREAARTITSGLVAGERQPRRMEPSQHPFDPTSARHRNRSLESSSASDTRADAAVLDRARRAPILPARLAQCTSVEQPPARRELRP